MGRRSNHFGGLGNHFPGNELESSLKDYPENAEELRLLLKTAGVLRRYTKAIKPRPEFVARIEARLKEACELKYGHRKNIATSLFKPLGHWAVSVAIAVVMAFLTFAGGFALVEATTKNTLPGQALYTVKVAAEKVRAAVIPSYHEKTSAISSSEEIKSDNISQVALGVETNRGGIVLPGVEEQLAKVENSQLQLTAGEGGGAVVKDKSAKSEPVPEHQPVAGEGGGAKSKDNAGKSEMAPGQRPVAGEGSGAGVKDTPGKPESVTGHQPAAGRGSGAEVKDNPGKSEMSPGQQSSKSPVVRRADGKGKLRK